MSLPHETAVGNTMDKRLTAKTKSRRCIPPPDIGKTSSIGDVGTIRSKLHERRSQLNMEITVENRIKQGSRKLAKISSLDNRTRDLAKLELEFSKSKMQVLQSELSRINSSIQAYQPKSARASQIPLIPLALKTTNDPDHYTIISDIISQHYYTDSAQFNGEIEELRELRKSMTTPPKDQSGIDQLYKYYDHFVLVIKRFLQPSIAQGFVFTWHDSINGLPASQKSTAYEKACVLFNIGALHTQIAAQQDRSSQLGIDQAICHLEHALGVFEYMKHNFSYSPTMDMSTEILSLISDLMRAEVIELQWEKTVLDGLNIDSMGDLVIYAQRNKLISECYKPIRELVEDHTLKNYWPPCWSGLIKIKDAYFRSEAHYYASIIHKRLGIQSTIDSSKVTIDNASLQDKFHTMYTADTANVTELFTPDTKVQMGLAKSHVNCSSLLQEYALRYKGMCRELDTVDVLDTVLSRASQLSQKQKEDLSEYGSAAMIAPTIQSSDVSISPVLPDFTRIKATDLFQNLGPLAFFSAGNIWTKPRTVTLKMIEKSYGFSIKGSKPARISSVDNESSAKENGVLVGDWVLAINGVNVKDCVHSDIVEHVQEANGDDLKLEITTPTLIRSRKLSTPLPSPTVNSSPSSVSIS